MRIALCSIGYDRHNILHHSMKSLLQCDGIDGVSWTLYVDGDSHPHFINEFPCKYVSRKVHIGLTKNILFAMQEQFGLGYEVVIIVEDDVIVSSDFIRFVKCCMGIRDNDVFSVSV